MLTQFWSRFREFRRSRPFWGGLFTILGGAEILLLPLSPVADLVLLGVAGMSGALIGVLLVILGLFVWFSPPNRTLSGVLSLVLSLASFVVSNLGGLVAGMVLGLVGGALTLAWAPDRSDRSPRRRAGRRGGGPGAMSMMALVALAVVPLVLLTGSGRAFAESTRGPDRAVPGPALPGPALPGPALPGPALPGPALPGPALPGPALPGPPLPVPPLPGPPLPDPPLPDGALPTPPLPHEPPPTPALPGSGLAPVVPGLAGLTGLAAPVLFAPPQPTVAPDPKVSVSGLVGDLRMDSLTVTNFRYQGMVEYPVAGGHGQRQRAMHIVVDSTDIANLRITIPGTEASKRVEQRRGAAHTTTTRLVLDCTRLRVTLLNLLTIEFSLDFPPPPLLVIPFLTATDVRIDYVRLDTPRLVIPGMRATADGPSGLRVGLVGGDGRSEGRGARQRLSPQQSARLAQFAALLKRPELLRPYDQRV